LERREKWNKKEGERLREAKVRNLKNEKEWQIALQSIESFQVVFQNPVAEINDTSLYRPEQEGCPFKLIWML